MGGGFSIGLLAMDRWVFEMLDTEHPVVCWLGTASMDSTDYYARFVDTWSAMGAITPRITAQNFGSRARMAELVESADAFYVGGGSPANMLALWRLHGLDALIRTAWERGALLTGISAGVNIWFESSSTDSFGPLEVLPDGLGLLPGHACPHYNTEPERRPTLRADLLAGRVASAVAIDDGAAALFTDGRLSDVVTTTPDAGIHQLHVEAGDVVETTLDSRLLA